MPIAYLDIQKFIHSDSLTQKKSKMLQNVRKRIDKHFS